MIHLNLWVIFKLLFFFSFDLKFRKSLRNGDLNPARDGMIAPLFFVVVVVYSTTLICG